MDEQPAAIRSGDFLCRAVLFDLDGVLVDSRECIERSWRRWATRHGLDAHEVLRVAHGRPIAETIRLVAPGVDAEHEESVLVDVEAHDADGVHAVPGAGDLLSHLPPGSWAVVTSAVRAVAEFRLRLVALPTPAVLIAADEVSRGKPDPECYLLAASRLRVPASECLVIEDTPAGVAAARAAGMTVVALTTTHAVDELGAAHAIVGALGSLTIETHAGQLAVGQRGRSTS